MIQIQVQRWPAHHVTLASTAPPGAWKLSRLGLHRRCGRNKANACCINLRGSRRSGSLLLAPFILNSATLYRLIFTFLIIYMCVCLFVHMRMHDHASSCILSQSGCIHSHSSSWPVQEAARDVDLEAADVMDLNYHSDGKWSVCRWFTY